MMRQSVTDSSIDVTKNVFYWSRVATIVAQGSGMHRRFAAASYRVIWDRELTSDTAWNIHS